MQEPEGVAASDDAQPSPLPSPCLLCGNGTGTRSPNGWLCSVCLWTHGEVPDHELPPPRVDVVYYLRFDRRVKIGTTANPRQRLSRIRHEQLLAFERGDRSLEQRRHRQFASDREGGEWFTLTAELQEHIAALTRGAPEPWTQHARWVSAAWSLRR